MKDIEAHYEKLRADAAEAQLVSDLATEVKKRELFAKIASHLNALASVLQQAMEAKEIGGSARQKSPP